MDFHGMNFDDHSNGIWRGWIRMANLKGEVPLGVTYLDLNAKRGTLTLKSDG
jgi:hypothetical protein